MSGIRTSRGARGGERGRGEGSGRADGRSKDSEAHHDERWVSGTGFPICIGAIEICCMLTY